MHVKTISKWDRHMVRNNLRAWFYGKYGWTVNGGTRVASFMLSRSDISTLFLSVSFVSSHFHPNQTSISQFILISQLPQPIIVSPVCAPECLLCFFFLPHSWSFSLWFLFRQQSISLFNLMLFSRLSCLCVWFGFSWRLAKKEQDFIRRQNSKKQTALLERNPEKKSKNSTNDLLLTN